MVFHLITAFPILSLIVRIQTLTFFFGSEYPGRKHVIICVLIQLFLCLIIFYFFYDSLAQLLSVFGACASFILVYAFPPSVKMIDYYLVKKGINLNGESSDLNNDSEDNKKSVKFRFKDILFFIGHFFFILIGIANVVFQFVPINFFNITLRE